ncbi:MAG: efflux RND transporter periplasmic adaptor subunit [Rhodanobacter sp.]|jgi:multidrug efflux pump subunit AcrA (membrane-fusion protein)|nr:efflux RND transporter periplasmic adaptor subunit [Rhodanobacter sp.]
MDIVKTSQTAWWRRPRTLWIGTGALALAGVLGLFVTLGKATPGVARSQLWIDTAKAGEMKREIRANGALVPRQIRWITAGATASVQEVIIEAGAKVKADTVILRLSNPELQAHLEKAEAALAGAQADVAAARTSVSLQLLDRQSAQAQAESEWRIAQVKMQAYQRAHDAGAISAIDLKQSQIVEQQSQNRAHIETQRVDAFRRTMNAQLQAAQARRNEAASALAVVRQQVDSLEVRAGIDGILQQVEVEPGQQVQAGAKLARVARPDELIARLQVPEMLAKDLVLELPVSVDTRNGMIAGKLIRIDPSVRNGSVAADVAFDAPLPPGARPDLSVDGRILLGTLHDVVSIGLPASVAPDSRATLFVIRPGDDVARRVPVHFGAASSDRIEVSEGLHAGDQVVLSDTSQWNDYDTLRLR